MHMEVKMFIDSKPEMVENQLNTWLAKERIRVCHITQSQSERNGKFVFVISVFYQQQKHVEENIYFDERKEQDSKITHGAAYS